MTQTKIANLIGVSQPAVKQYLKEEEEAYLSRLEKLGLTREEINELISQLNDILEKGDIKESMSFITIKGLHYLSELKFCRYHKSIDPEIPFDCDICKALYKEDEEKVMEIALSLLQTEEISKLIPEVLSNLAYAKKGAKDENDILAIPGRITVVRGIPTPVSRPSWGASKHLARVLLYVMNKDPKVRAVMNLKYNDVVLKALKKLDFKFTMVGPSDNSSDEEIARAVGEAFKPGVDAVIHLGGKGIEANTYVFGEDPLGVVRKVKELAAAYLKEGGY